MMVGHQIKFFLRGIRNGGADGPMFFTTIRGFVRDLRELRDEYRKRKDPETSKPTDR